MIVDVVGCDDILLLLPQSSSPTIIANNQQ